MKIWILMDFLKYSLQKCSTFQYKIESMSINILRPKLQ